MKARRYGMVGVQTDLKYANGKPFRDRRINCRIVVCPECKAAIGEPCISKTGNEKTRTHVSRRRIAIRESR